jgi:hypothetical protein
LVLLVRKMAFAGLVETEQKEEEEEKRKGR